jgi:hypothetical protein
MLNYKQENPRGNRAMSEIGFGQDIVDIKRIQEGALKPVDSVSVSDEAVNEASTVQEQETYVEPFARPAPRLVFTKNDWYENNSSDPIGDMRKAVLCYKSQMAKDSYTERNGEMTGMTETSTTKPQIKNPLNRLNALSKMITG